jgi:hypothetical protein
MPDDDVLNLRQLPGRDYLRLKTATKELTEAAGGATRAASVARPGIEAGRLSRYGNPHEALFAPLDVIADLEAECGEPVVTRALAELAGYQLVPRTGKTPSGEHLAKVFGTVAGEMGEMLRQTGAAVADGRITAAEIAAIDRTAAQTETTLASLRADLARVATRRKEVAVHMADHAPAASPKPPVTKPRRSPRRR